MRVLTQSELNRFTKAELFALLRRIAGELPGLKEGSAMRRLILIAAPYLCENAHRLQR